MYHADKFLKQVEKTQNVFTLFPDQYSVEQTRLKEHRKRMTQLGKLIIELRSFRTFWKCCALRLWRKKNW
jgi:hypothetical protein